MPQISFPKPLLKAAREKTGLRQKELAAQFELSHSTWSKLECGQSVNLSFKRIGQLQAFIDNETPEGPFYLLKKVLVPVSKKEFLAEVARRHRLRQASPDSDSGEKRFAGR